MRHERVAVTRPRLPGCGLAYHRRACRSERTKRGAERTPLDGDFDVLICGASFAGPGRRARAARARGARVLMSTATRSASARPRACARADGVAARPGPDGLASARRSASWWSTRPHGDVRWPLPWTFSTFDYRELCALLRAQGDARRSRPRRSTGAHAAHDGAHRPRRPARAAGRRRARLAADARRATATSSRPTRRLSRGLEVHPARQRRRTSSSGSTARYVPRRLRLELPGRRRAARRRRLVRPALPRQGADRAAGRGPRRCPPCATRATGSRTSCAPPTEDGIFFAGDSAGHCLPLDRRGHPHRVLLRHRLRARAARRGRGPPDARAGAARATARSPTRHALEVPLAAARAAARPARRPAAA